MEAPESDITKRLQEASRQAGDGRYKLCLYVSGNSSRSVRAINNLQHVIEQYLPGRVDLEIVDIYQQDDQSMSDTNLVATPMLVKSLPLPLRRLIGDLSNEGRVLVALDLADLGGGE